MNPNEYQALAQCTECGNKRPKEKTYNASPLSARLLHATLGMASETGELADAIKKWLYYDQSLDVTNIIEELGDCLWYVALACNALDVSLEEVMERNIAKLHKRYPEKFTEAKAAEENRDREAERKIMEEERTLQKLGLYTPQAEIDTVEIPKCSCVANGCEACEGKSMAAAMVKDSTESYRRLCSVCKTARIHNRNKSGLCPDCAADRRRLNS